MRRLNVFPNTWAPCSDDFDPAFTPGSIRYRAALCGAPVAESGPGYAYCELGAGSGAHLVALSCLLPDIDLWGVEPNPSSVLEAGQLMRACNSANVTLAPLELRRFLDADTPAFDCLVMREGFTALSPEDRELVAAIAARKLKCGGALVLGYEALPVAAPFQTLVSLLRELWFHAAGNEGERLEKALGTLEKMLDTGQGLFFPNQPTTELCRSLLRMDRRDLLHRYLAPDYAPVWFHELAETLAVHGILFQGSLDVQNRLAAALSESAAALLDETSEPDLRELLRDGLTASPWRRDIFTRGTFPADVSPILVETPFTTNLRDGEYADVLRTARGEIRLDMLRHLPVLERLRGGSASPAALDLDGYTPEAIADICAVRLATGETAIAAAAADPDRVRACNAGLLRRAVSRNAMTTLVSPQGGCAPVNPMTALFCLALENGRDPLDYASDAIEAQLRAAGREDDPVRRRRILIRQYEGFSDTLGELRRMGILPEGPEARHDA